MNDFCNQMARKHQKPSLNTLLVYKYTYEINKQSSIANFEYIDNKNWTPSEWYKKMSLFK